MGRGRDRECEKIRSQWHFCCQCGFFYCHNAAVLWFGDTKLNKGSPVRVRHRRAKLYVVGGGGSLLKNFFPIAPDKIIINSDICATAKGYEYMADVKNVTGGVK